PDDDFYPLDMERLMRKNLTLTGGITRRRREMLATANDYLKAHPDLYDTIVTHTYPAERAQEAYELAQTPAPDRLKVVLTTRCAAWIPAPGGVSAQRPDPRATGAGRGRPALDDDRPGDLVVQALMERLVPELPQDVEQAEEARDRNDVDHHEAGRI